MSPIRITHRARRLLPATLVAGAVALAAPSLAAATPGNDRWQAATPVTKQLVTTVDARAATADATEPLASCTGATAVPNAVWYRVTPPKGSGRRMLRAVVRGQASPAVLAVFAVQPHAGTELACAKAAAATAGGFEHVLADGMAYYVLVGSAPGTTGGDVLEVRLELLGTQWQAQTPLAARRQGVQVAAHGTSVYAFGGLQTSFVPGADSGFHSMVVNRLDAGTGEWKVAAQMPIGLSYGQAATVGGRIHIPGGQANPVRGAGCAVGTHLVFDPRTSSFSEAAAPSGPATWDYAAASDEARGIVYMAGGVWDPTPCDFGAERNDQLPTGRIRAWHVGTARWFELAPLTQPRQGSTAQVVGGRLVVMGGLVGSVASTVVERYDPVSGQLTRLPDLPLAVYGATSGLGQGKDGRPLVYVTGGWTHVGGGADTGATQVYDVRANRWYLLAARMTPRDAVRGAVANGHLYAIGGHGPQPIRAVERLKVDAAPPTVRLVRRGGRLSVKASDPAGIASIEWRVGTRLVARGARPRVRVTGGRVTVRDQAGNARTVRT